MCLLNRPAVFFRRMSAFTKVESAGTDLSGSWTETAIMRRDMAAYQEASNTLAFFEIGGSKGSFVTDVDGNTLLDLCSMENQPLGHNHSELLKVSFLLTSLTSVHRLLAISRGTLASSTQA